MLIKISDYSVNNSIELYQTPNIENYQQRNEQPDSTTYTFIPNQTFSHYQGNLDSPVLDYVSTSTTLPIERSTSRIINSSGVLQQKRGCLQLWQFLIALLNSEQSIKYKYNLLLIIL